ncbi:MAG: Fic family protein [Lentisphaerae bacterium]|jgi:Fic family protein|nr:Fic family protein [Lentisphaerota bacterium]
MNALFGQIQKLSPHRLARVLEAATDERIQKKYLHWDEIRRFSPPKGVTSKEWWFAIKTRRSGQYRPVALRDKSGAPFQFWVPDTILEVLHRIDREVGGVMQTTSEPILNPHTRNRYLIRSLVEEAITSSQLEGAATTREVAKEMIRSGRPARDRSEQMILNNYRTMQWILEIKDREMSPELVLEMHRRVTEKTLDDPEMAGRFRRPDQRVVLSDIEGEVYHDPPLAKELPARCQVMCDFANGKTPDYFVHPAVRAIILHFWLAFDHPFVDGNGRTARALFYWAMLRGGFWMFEFISISTILRKSPARYARSYLYTETDDNDLTYFIVYQTEVIQRAIKELFAYIERKTAEASAMESHLRALRLFNHRQTDLLRHALKHPHGEYVIQGHQHIHRVAYQTARTDLLELQSKGLLNMYKRGKQMVFTVPGDLILKLRKMG